MAVKNIRQLIKKRIVLLDGACGTELQARGLPAGTSPELWCLKNPEVLSGVHRDYIRAGADIIYTCTFGANHRKLSSCGDGNARAVNRQLARIAKKTAGKKVLVAGDIGPTGAFIEPFGDCPFEEAVSIFREQAKGLREGGVDLFIIETMMDIQEARAALLAVKEISNAFTMVTLTFETSGRTLNGTDAVSALITLQSLGADAVGANCSSGPQKMIPLLKAMKPYATVPLIAKPNAGMPRLAKGKTVFDMRPRQFAHAAKALVKAGANIIGGCCGTTPGHIKALKGSVQTARPVPARKKILPALSSATSHIVLDKRRGLVVIGECINPTGKKSLTAEIKERKPFLLRNYIHRQEQAGAHLLDVNVGISGIDEVRTLSWAISYCAAATRLGLVIDTTNPDALERALRMYPGRALINSISGTKEKLPALLSVARKYGAMFILLPLSGKTIPHTFRERKRIIREVLRAAKKKGFSNDDIVVDALSLALSSMPQAANVCCKTVSFCTNTLKVNTVTGLSNVSFGLPHRVSLNAAYLAMLCTHGLGMVILNPLQEELMRQVRALDALCNKDRRALGYCRYYSAKVTASPPAMRKGASAEEKIFDAILQGDKDGITEYIDEGLRHNIKPQRIIDAVMVKAINTAGELFDRKEYFLPQLIASAEAMKTGCTYLERHITPDAKAQKAKTIILLATVKGDIHDIGKNIVSLMLKNHGFKVIDLGKDVPAKTIIRELKKHKAPIVGLSALMTTTMMRMKEVIALAKKEGVSCRFIIGGAVVTRSFARSIGAEYAHDGVDAVRVAMRRIPPP